MAWVANRSTSVRKPITAISNVLPGERRGVGGLARIAACCMAGLSMVAAPRRVTTGRLECRLGGYRPAWGTFYLPWNTSDDRSTAGSAPLLTQ